MLTWAILKCVNERYSLLMMTEYHSIKLTLRLLLFSYSGDIMEEDCMSIAYFRIDTNTHAISFHRGHHHGWFVASEPHCSYCSHTIQARRRLGPWMVCCQVFSFVLFSLILPSRRAHREGWGRSWHGPYGFGHPFCGRVHAYQPHTYLPCRGCEPRDLGCNTPALGHAIRFDSC